MKPQRGKAPTRGVGQIMSDIEEMKTTYQIVTFVVTVIRLFISAVYTVGGIKPNFFTQSVTNIILCHFGIPALLLLLTYIICKMCVPIYSPDRRLICPGYDLMRNGGLGQWFSEMSAITVLTHLLTVVSNKFWFLLLLIPLRWLYNFWKYVIVPIIVIIFTRDNEPEDPERIRQKAKKKKKVKYLRTIKHWHHFSVYEEVVQVAPLKSEK